MFKINQAHTFFNEDKTVSSRPVILYRAEETKRNPRPLIASFLLVAFSVLTLAQLSFVNAAVISSISITSPITSIESPSPSPSAPITSPGFPSPTPIGTPTPTPSSTPTSIPSPTPVVSPTPTPTPSPSPSFTVKSFHSNIKIKRGDSKNLLQVKSDQTKNINASGYFSASNTSQREYGITITPSFIGTQDRKTTQIKINVNKNVNPGVYQGYVIIYTLNPTLVYVYPTRVTVTK